MPMVINTNSQALNTIQNLERNKAEITSSMEKLSSGLRINKAADDSADLAMATRMAAQIGSIIQASANAQAGVSLINIADSALGSIAESITNLRTLAVQAANGTLTSVDRTEINKNADALLDQINSVVAQTNFNGLNLIDGTLNTTLQIGTQAGDTIAIEIASANTADIGVVIVNSEEDETINGALRTGDLAIDGINIAPSVSDGLSYRSSDASAIAIANAINASGTNVKAVANPTVTEVSEFAAPSSSSGTISINGVKTTTIDVTDDLKSNVQNAITAINTMTTKTGVVASANKDNKLILTAPDGRNITVDYDGVENTDFGAVVNGNTFSSITLTSNSPITIGGANPNRAGLEGGTTSKLTALDNTDLSTQAGAVSALAVIDGALDTISDLRAGIGATENRLYSMIENLGNNSVNLIDAKSQIMDTDFAVEMANFAKLQILQQASITMLSQANSGPQSILKILG